MLTARDHKDGTVAREALASLCSTYWYPLYAFIRRQGANPHDAEDLTQEFLYRFLDNGTLQRATPEAGKFRSFLLVCLKRFLINQHERDRAQRRGAGRPAVSLNSASAETQYLAQPAENVTPEVLFDRQWAFTVLDRALEGLQEEYQLRGQAGLFQALRGFLPGSGGEPSRAEIAAKHGLNPGALDVAIHRVRRRLAVVLREQVAQTVSSPTEVEEEIQYLIAALGR